MLRLHVPSPPVAGTIEITGAELRHFHTLRLGVGDRVIVFDGAGSEHMSIVTGVTTRAATVQVEQTNTATRESPRAIILAPALLKGRKLDLVIEKATELGVQRFAPFVSAHSIGERDHRERWERIALAASKQSGRTRVPTVEPARSFDALVAAPWPGLRLLAWEEEAAQRLGALPADATEVLLVVGPEGGFAPAEVATARARGFTSVTLGPRVLRAETAAIVATALAQQRWGDL